MALSQTLSDVLTLLSWLQNWDWFGMGLGMIINPKAPVCVQFFSLFNSSVPPVGLQLKLKRIPHPQGASCEGSVLLFLFTAQKWVKTLIWDLLGTSKPHI